MKKRNKIISIALLSLLVIGVVSAVGYNLFTATSQFNIEEGIEVQYWDGTNWVDLPVVGGVFDFGIATINPGETDSFIVRARNIASSGAVGLTLEIETVDGISHDIECYGTQSDGLKYTKRTDVYYFEAVGNIDWKAIKVNTVADGNLPPGTISFNNYLTRDNVLPSYEEIC